MPKKSSSSSNSRSCCSNLRTNSSAVGSGLLTLVGATTSPKRSISSSSNEFPVEITLSDDNDLFGMSSSQLLLSLSLLLLALPKLTVVLRNTLADGAKVRPPVDDLKPAARFDTHWLTIAGTRFPYNTQRYKNKLTQD